MLHLKLSRSTTLAEVSAPTVAEALENQADLLAAVATLRQHGYLMSAAEVLASRPMRILSSSWELVQAIVEDDGIDFDCVLADCFGEEDDHLVALARFALWGDRDHDDPFFGDCDCDDC